MNKNPSGKTGLALGGGAVLGATHIGVLKALEEREVSIDCISGTSIGAVVAALYAFGKSWEEIKEISEKMNWMEISKINVSKMSLLTNDKLGKVLEEAIGDPKFSDSDIPLAMITVDIIKEEKVIIDSGSVIKGILASTCIPGIFKPVKLDNKLLVDGGLVESVPVTPLINWDCDSIIAVDLTRRNPQREPKNILEVLFKSMNIVIAAGDLSDSTDVLIQPDLKEFNVYDSSQVDDLVDVGYKAALSALKGEKR